MTYCRRQREITALFSQESRRKRPRQLFQECSDEEEEWPTCSFSLGDLGHQLTGGCAAPLLDPMEATQNTQSSCSGLQLLKSIRSDSLHDKNDTENCKKNDSAMNARNTLARPGSGERRIQSVSLSCCEFHVTDILKTSQYICVYMYMYRHIYIYIYIYTHKDLAWRLISTIYIVPLKFS